MPEEASENEEHDQAKHGTARWVAVSFEVQQETHEHWDLICESKDDGDGNLAPSMPKWREMYEEWVILQELLGRSGDLKQIEWVPLVPLLYKKHQVHAQVFGFPLMHDNIQVWVENHNIHPESETYVREKSEGCCYLDNFLIPANSFVFKL
ncbi:hypothetical protein L208DRAFT_1382807 [Tricholoma matsutake]|nr:hypothetical protein L208DRAFT_1382807 [Tricholoma matsutake 945]